MNNNLAHLWAQIEFYRSSADSLESKEAISRETANVELALASHYRTAAADLELRVRRLAGDEAEPEGLHIPEATLRIEVPDFAKESNPPPVTAMPSRFNQAEPDTKTSHPFAWPCEQIDVPGSEQTTYSDALHMTDRMEAFRLCDDALDRAADWLRAMGDRDGMHVTRKQAKKCRGMASVCEDALVSLRNAGEL